MSINGEGEYTYEDLAIKSSTSDYQTFQLLNYEEDKNILKMILTLQ